MQLNKSQKMMVEDGFPPSLFRTDEQRKAYWRDNPPKPMPSFTTIAKQANDQETLKLLAEIEEGKKVKTKNRIHKMLIKKEDRTGQRWDSRRSRWVSDDLTAKKEQAMISLTTNTRGMTKMPTKDYAEMSGPELVEAYNKKSGKPPIKKFKDKATGLAAMAKLTTEKVAKATAAKVSAVSKPKTAKEPKEGSTNKLAAEFGARVGSFREKLIIAFDESYRKLIKVEDLLKAVYGSKNNENTGALTMVIKGAQTMIEKNKLPYELKKEKNEAKELSFGLWPK